MRGDLRDRGEHPELGGTLGTPEIFLHGFDLELVALLRLGGPKLVVSFLFLETALLPQFRFFKTPPGVFLDLIMAALPGPPMSTRYTFNGSAQRCALLDLFCID